MPVLAVQPIIWWDWEPSSRASQSAWTKTDPPRASASELRKDKMIHQALIWAAEMVAQERKMAEVAVPKDRVAVREVEVYHLEV